MLPGCSLGAGPLLPRRGRSPSLRVEGYRVVRGNSHCEVVTFPRYKLEWVSDEDPLAKPTYGPPLPEGWEPTLPPPTEPPAEDRPAEPKGTLIHVGSN